MYWILNLIIYQSVEKHLQLFEIKREKIGQIVYTIYDIRYLTKSKIVRIEEDVSRKILVEGSTLLSETQRPVLVLSDFTLYSWRVWFFFFFTIIYVRVYLAVLLAGYLFEYLWGMNIFCGICQLYRFMIPSPPQPPSPSSTVRKVCHLRPFLPRFSANTSTTPTSGRVEHRFAFVCRIGERNTDDWLTIVVNRWLLRLRLGCDSPLESKTRATRPFESVFSEITVPMRCPFVKNNPRD